MSRRRRQANKDRPIVWQMVAKQMTPPRERARKTRHECHMDTPIHTKEYERMPVQLQIFRNPAPSTFHREKIGIRANDCPSKNEQIHTPVATLLDPAALAQTVKHYIKTKTGVLVSM